MMGKWFNFVIIVPVIILWGCRAGRGAPETASADTASPAEGAVTGSFFVVGPEERRLPAGITIFEAGAHASPRWEGLAEEPYALPPGRYDMLIEYFGQKYWRRGVELAGGEETVYLPMGTLAVEGRSSRGDRLEGEVEVFAAGRAEGPPVMEGETFEGLPLLAGTYDVRATLQGRERWLRGVTVGKGDSETLMVIEPVGYLRVEVLDQDGEPLAAEVWVYVPGSGHVPAAWGKSDRPLALLPGRYDVAVRWAETREYSSGIAVLENQTTVERFTLWRGEAP